MTAQVKRFPKKTAETRTPEEQRLWVKYDRLANRLQGFAKRAQLIALAALGVDDADDEMASISDAAFVLRDDLTEIAEEARL